jgi:tetratricopeptide (TPR) repeat protein
MESPDVEGLNVIGSIESGGSGSVYRAEDAAGNQLALKLFDDEAISRNLLSRMTSRISTGDWPEGVMPVLFSDFESAPAVLVSPLQAEVNDGKAVPRSLQHRLDYFSGSTAWPLIRLIAQALAALHAKRVAHGNLKPGNVFFDTGGRVLLADWALGNMPEVLRFEFTDAVLYQPPEQLRHPAGYLAEAGYGWDVFAFGVLAFRLVTGKFPRCDETFSKVAPAPGTSRVDAIRADLGKIATKLENAGEIVWPEATGDPAEAGLRHLIDSCLRLDPARRPSTMAEVLAGFAAADHAAATTVEHELLLDQKRQANHRAWRWVFATAAAVVFAMLMAAGWYLAPRKFAVEKNRQLQTIAALRTQIEDSNIAKDAAEHGTADAKKALDYEREVNNTRLEASRMIGDRLFAWAMEKGHRRLPPLDGREQRLKSLERYFEDFLERTAGIPSLEDERAQVRVELAEISLASGDANLAIRRLGEGLDAWKPLRMDADQRFRMAKNRLLLALLLQSNNDPRMEAAFAESRKELGDIPQTEVDADRLQQLLAILDFNEAKFLSAHGNSSKALEQLMTATQTLNRLADERPDSVVLRSELAGCYLSSATILEGMGNLGDAREVQSLAASEILKLLKQYPQDPGLRFDLAGCYAGMAESAVLSGDIVNADTLSGESMKLLAGLIREQPDHTEAISRMASQIGLRAGLMRDRGETNAALKSFDEGIRLLESVRASNSGDALVNYRLALLWWQKGRILGMAGKRDEEIDLIRQAESTLIKLEAEKQSGGPPMEKIQSSSAYLLGDLGHALQMAGKKDDAKSAFAESIAFWERLLQAQPKSEEFIESLAWCRQRIKELK